MIIPLNLESANLKTLQENKIVSLLSVGYKPKEVSGTYWCVSMGFGTGGSRGVMLTGTSSLLIAVISLTLVLLFLDATDVVVKCY